MASNSLPLVVARFLLACPFLVASMTTFALLKDKVTASYAIEQNRAVINTLGELGKQVPQDKLAVFLAVTQGLGGFLMVFNHKFGGILLVMYLLPMTLLTHQFWREEEYGSVQEQLDVLVRFLEDAAILGGLLMFITTTDGVPLKVKRKPHLD
ncbi:hypothetical protein VOLCADRAFT_104697 [Volvox carteri f. nagariensis]|uniref:DoxX family protein n=1 Tax=Volvox carteri f. nagariensis TaxID=3068 RepID=D8TV50_VOLCA|nr:uncharacterized protein VOLCADRAFT_104697 [Volvox carteri f. nagariensis]EFJ48515.1 hypothetical protein VOLCADRAFT_104697 [Volvox carteri f. nagariensis]|eukprot:XP_002950314.1 hypothetical protein VOLCADRAFT_104697 [Volvox carteri f. nagariensis]